MWVWGQFQFLKNVEVGIFKKCVNFSHFVFQLVSSTYKHKDKRVSNTLKCNEKLT